MEAKLAERLMWVLHDLDLHRSDALTDILERRREQFSEAEYVDAFDALSAECNANEAPVSKLRSGMTISDFADNHLADVARVEELIESLPDDVPENRAELARINGEIQRLDKRGTIRASLVKDGA